jgi:pentatricopeptide repeat protein
VGRVARGYEIMQKMKKKGCPPTTVTYNTVLDGFCQGGEVDKARSLLLKMARDGVKMDAFTHNTFLALILKIGNVDEALETLRNLIDGGFSPNAVTLNIFLNSFNKLDLHATVHDVLALMPMGCLVIDDITHDILIQNLFVAGKVPQGCILLNEIKEKGFSIGETSYTRVIFGLCNIGRLEEALEVLQDMVDRSVVPETIIYDVLIENLCDQNKVDDAVRVFRILMQGNGHPFPKTSSTLLNVLRQSGRTSEHALVMNYVRSKM